MLTTQARKREHLIGQVQIHCKGLLQKHLITYTETIVNQNEKTTITDTISSVYGIMRKTAELACN